MICFLRFSGYLLFLSAIRKKKITKRKTAGYAPELKNPHIFLNEKNSLRSNSFSFFTENTRFFFTLLHWGRKSPPLEGTSLRSWCGCTRDPSLRYASLFATLIENLFWFFDRGMVWMTKKTSEAKKRKYHTPTSESLTSCAMIPRSFTTLRSTLDDKKTSEAKKEKHHTPTSEAMLHKKTQRSGLTFLPWSEGAFWSVKNKKLFER